VTVKGGLYKRAIRQQIECACSHGMAASSADNGLEAIEDNLTSSH
jgi:hypothetical protein